MRSRSHTNKLCNAFGWNACMHACACQRTCRAHINTQIHTCVHASSGPASDDDDDDYSNAQLQLLYNLLLWFVLRFLFFFFSPFSSQLPVSIVLAPYVYVCCCLYGLLLFLNSFSFILFLLSSGFFLCVLCMSVCVFQFRCISARYFIALKK